MAHVGGLVSTGPGISWTGGFDCCGVWFYSSLLTHLLTVQDQTDSFFACGDAIHPCCESRRLAGENGVSVVHVTCSYAMNRASTRLQVYKLRSGGP